MTEGVGAVHYGDSVARQVSRRFGGWVADTTELAAIGPARRSDGMVVVAGTAAYYFDADAVSGQVAPATGSGYWKLTGGAATAAANVAVTDAGAYYTATNVETILAEIGPYQTGRLQKTSVTITEANLTNATPGASETENVGAALPANARIVGVDAYLTTQFTGGDVSAVAVDVGIAGETEAMIKDFDAFGSTAAKSYCAGASAGTRVKGLFGGQQIIATFTPDGGHALSALTAGSVTVNVDWYVPA